MFALFPPTSFALTLLSSYLTPIRWTSWEAHLKPPRFSRFYIQRLLPSNFPLLLSRPSAESSCTRTCTAIGVYAFPQLALFLGATISPNSSIPTPFLRITLHSLSQSHSFSNLYSSSQTSSGILSSLTSFLDAIDKQFAVFWVLAELVLEERGRKHVLVLLLRKSRSWSSQSKLGVLTLFHQYAVLDVFPIAESPE